MFDLQKSAVGAFYLALCTTLKRANMNFTESPHLKAGCVPKEKIWICCDSAAFAASVADVDLWPSRRSQSHPANDLLYINLFTAELLSDLSRPPAICFPTWQPPRAVHTGLLVPSVCECVFSLCTLQLVITQISKMSHSGTCVCVRECGSPAAGG